MADAKPTAPALALVVKHAFADYQIGDQISDPVLVKSILEGETAAYVLKTLA